MPSKIQYADFPIDECAAQAKQRAEEVERAGNGCAVYQKWTCQHCGSRQTMGEKNKFFRSGKCEACGQLTVISKCNWMMHIQFRGSK